MMVLRNRDFFENSLTVSHGSYDRRRRARSNSLRTVDVLVPVNMSESIGVFHETVEYEERDIYNIIIIPKGASNSRRI